MNDRISATTEGPPYQRPCPSAGRSTDGGDGGPGRALGHLGLDLLEDRGEELALVGELVVEGAPGDPGRAHDLLGAHGGEAPLGEEGTGGRHERGAPRQPLSGQRMELHFCVWVKVSQPMIPGQSMQVRFEPSSPA